jgi:hypothetical protein
MELIVAAIMFEVVRDWNYATAVICSESAFYFRRTRSDRR